jgi:hypothetical protein
VSSGPITWAESPSPIAGGRVDKFEAYEPKPRRSDLDKKRPLLLQAIAHEARDAGGAFSEHGQKSLARAATFSRAARMLASAFSPHVFSTANARTSRTPTKRSQNST